MRRLSFLMDIVVRLIYWLEKVFEQSTRLLDEVPRLFYLESNEIGYREDGLCVLDTVYLEENHWSSRR